MTVYSLSDYGRIWPSKYSVATHPFTSCICTINAGKCECVCVKVFVATSNFYCDEPRTSPTQNVKKCLQIYPDDRRDHRAQNIHNHSHILNTNAKPASLANGSSPMQPPQQLPPHDDNTVHVFLRISLSLSVLVLSAKVKRDFG